MFFSYIALFGAIIISSAGQILLKAGASNSIPFIMQLLRPTTLLGLACYGIAAPLFILSLRNIPLSVAGPMASTTYIIVAISGWFLFEEHVGTNQIAGIVLIVTGVILLSRA